jgi:DNA-binding XRE family transcriptional regulator
MQYVYLRAIAQQHVLPDYVEATQRYLAAETALLKKVARHLVGVFPSGAKSYKDPVSVGQVEEWIETIFADPELWFQIAQAFWVNLLAWTLQDLESSIGESVILDMEQPPFKPDVWEQFFSPQVLETRQMLAALEDSCSQAIAIALFPTFQDTFLSPASAEKSITPSPVGLTVPLWATLSPPISSDRFPYGEGDSDPTANVQPFEYTLTHRQDIETLPWRILDYLLARFHPTVTQLHLICAAQLAHHTLPATSFTLKASQILTQEYFTNLVAPSEGLSYPLLLQTLQTLTQIDLICLWLNAEPSPETPAVRFRGKLWDMLLESHGTLDWNTQSDIALSEVYITLRPSLWITQFLHQSNDYGTLALMQFGAIAQALLQQDRLANIPFLKLLCFLCLYPSGEDTYAVELLLKKAFDTDALNQLFGEPETHYRLLDWWNHAVSSLGQVGWRAQSTDAPVSVQTCYQPGCPPWLDPHRKLRKPQDWLFRWLEQSVVLRPPVPKLSDRIPFPEVFPPFPQSPLRLRRFDRLTGSEIRAARKAKQWTQVQLAEVLDVHPSLIAKIETGQRSISDALDASLRDLFEFNPR